MKSCSSYIINLLPLQLTRKIGVLNEQVDIEDNKINDYYISKFLAKVTELFPDELENQDCIKAMITYQYETRTTHFFHL